MILSIQITNPALIDNTISGYIAEEMSLKRLLDKVPYRIIFMDIEMPFQSGIVTARKIKQ